ncbi:hypothetical protein ACPEIC_35795 [Stenotrophomonas sp. NPDC087984]
MAGNRTRTINTVFEFTIPLIRPVGDKFARLLVSDGSGMGVGFSVDANGTDASILYQLADRIPDAYVELYSVGLPPVPGSHRPARPRLTQNEVLWEDPDESGTWQCRVGAYPGTSADGSPSA